MSTLDVVLERLERLEVENASLRASLATVMVQRSAGVTGPAEPEVSRRQLLGRAGRAVGVMGVGTLAAMAGVAATGGQALAAANLELGNTSNTSSSETRLLSTAPDVALRVEAGSTANAVELQTAGSGAGLRAFSPDGIGVGGTSFDGIAGVHGLNYGAHYGVLGEVDKAAGSGGAGVRGRHPNGRGGVFSGKRAAVQLVASTASSHPSSGSRGDLYVDKSGRLWFCKGGSTWRQLA